MLGLGSLVPTNLLYLAFCYVIFLSVIVNGIKTSSKVAMVTVCAPYVLFLILLVKVFTLPGSHLGLQYMTIPRYERLLKLSVWQMALNQAFFQNNIGSGISLTFASLHGPQSSAATASVALSLANVLSSLLTSAIVFGFIGHFSYLSGTAIQDLPLSGASLVFVTYPACLAMLPWPRLWLSLFFISMLCLSVDTQIGILETVSHFFIDARDAPDPPRLVAAVSRLSERRIRALVCAVSFACAVPLCFESGFRTLAFLNQFCVVVASCLPLVMDVTVFFWAGGCRVKLSRFVQSCLRFWVAPLTIGIFVSWLCGVPRLMRAEFENGDFLSLVLGIFYNMCMVLAPICYAIRG